MGLFIHIKMKAQKVIPYQGLAKVELCTVSEKTATIHFIVHQLNLVTKVAEELNFYISPSAIWTSISFMNYKE